MTVQLTEAILILPARAALGIADLLEGLDAPKALSVSAFEIPGTADFQVQALYQDAPSPEVLQSILAPLMEAFELPPPLISLNPLQERDWVAESLTGLPPVTAGRFFVAGGHHLHHAPRAALVLHVEAGQAFGTGHHDTTAGCLLALSHLARLLRPDRVLDLGCGSGILAMAAAKLWRRPVTASDIDGVATRIAGENAARNGLAPFMNSVTAPGFTHPAITAAAPYDLILANILARPLMRLAFPMANHLTKGGYAVLSGLLRTQEAAVLSTYRSQGLFLARRFLSNEWSTLLLRKRALG